MDMWDHRQGEDEMKQPGQRCWELEFGGQEVDNGGWIMIDMARDETVLKRGV